MGLRHPVVAVPVKVIRRRCNLCTRCPSRRRDRRPWQSRRTRHSGRSAGAAVCLIARKTGLVDAGLGVVCVHVVGGGYSPLKLLVTLGPQATLVTRTRGSNSETCRQKCRNCDWSIPPETLKQGLRYSQM